MASAVCSCWRVRRASSCWAFEHVDVGCRRFDGGFALPAPHAIGLLGVGLRLLERLAAVDLPRRQILLTLQFEVGARRTGLGGGELRLGLIDRRQLRGGLLAERSMVACCTADLILGGLRREPVVAVVDAGDDVAGFHRGVVLDGDVGDVAGDLGRQRRVLGADVGIVGADQIAARRPPVVAVVGAAAESPAAATTAAHAQPDLADRDGALEPRHRRLQHSLAKLLTVRLPGLARSPTSPGRVSLGCPPKLLIFVHALNLNLLLTERFGQRCLT